MDIGIRLNKNFTTQYNKLQNEFGTEIAKLNGFADEQLSYNDFIDNFIDKQVVADSSIDGNSNVASKNINTLLNEMPKPHRKLLAYNKIYYEMQKKFGFKEANKFLRYDWIGWTYLHDADTSTFRHYCYAYDLKGLAEKGLFFIDRNFNNQPAKHLSTFIDFVKEFISYTSNLSSGACGLPNLIPYMYYFWKKDIDNDYMGIKTSHNEQKYAEQQIQRFVYAVNQPYVRDSIQSAFTNTSIFDHPYFEALFGGSEFPDGSFMIDFEEEIIEFEKLFLTIVSEIRSENMFTFPVNSISLLRTQDNTAFVDEEFAKWAVKHNMKWSDSNLFCDTSVNSLSNCCRLKSDITELYFNSIGGTALSVGSVKVDTVNLARLALESSTPDDFLEKVYEATYTVCEVLDCVRHIIKRNEEKGLLPNFSHGLVEWDHLYNTTGVIGVYESLKRFGFVEFDEYGNAHYTSQGEELGKEIFNIIRAAQNQFLEDYKITDYKINVEQIPKR